MTKAIILAAGMGTRLRPLTESTHKSLLTINNQPFLERSIDFLLQQDVEEIVIVTGYLKEQFNYLLQKYKEVKIVNNEYFDKYNNVYSLYLVRGYLGDCFILEGDLYLHQSIFQINNQTRSNYYVKQITTDKQEWIVDCDEQEKIVNIRVDGVESSDFISAGITYLSDADGAIIENALSQLNFEQDAKNLYWDEILIENLHHLQIYAAKIPEGTVFEIDDVQDYDSLKQQFNKS
ncbi:MAG: phosphocholine cytidylyltransferase family protein [Solibacillus sp.]